MGGNVVEFVVDGLGKVDPRRAAATGAGICDEFFPFVLLLALALALVLATTGCEDEDPTNQFSTLESEEVVGPVVVDDDDDEEEEDDVAGMISFSLFFTVPDNHPVTPLSAFFKEPVLLLVATPGRIDINFGG